MEKIYIRKKDNITGPYDARQLQLRGLHATDQVWYQGLDEWQPAPKVDFLKRYISAAQPLGFFSRILGAR